jgi:WD40 repeat protein
MVAIDACHRADVINAFADGLLWTTLGEKPDLAAKLGDLHKIATGKPPAVAGVEDIGRALAKALAGRRYLVVVDDAWRPEDIAPFLDLDGPLLLVTTRIRSLVEQAGRTGWPEVPVDEMEDREAAAILARGLAIQGTLQETLVRLADRLGCWPLLLELANARLLEEQKERKGNVSESIRRVTSLFERSGVLGFDRRNSDQRNAAVANSVNVGLGWADKMFPGLAEKAAEMSVFPEDVAIPQRVLADLWAMDEFDLEEDALRPLANLSLLQWAREAGEVRSHDMIRRVLETRLAEPSAVHHRQITAWGDPYHLPHDYAWRFLIRHMRAAGQDDEADRLLMSYDWIEAKLRICGAYDLFQAYLPESRDEGARIVGRAVGLSLSALAENPLALPHQLYGRLDGFEQPAVAALVERARQDPNFKPAPRWPGLTPPGAERLRLQHRDVLSAAFSPKADRIVTASRDGTARLWNAGTGQELAVLRWHTNPLTDRLKVPCFSSDGACLVVSDDERTHLWDAATGQEITASGDYTDVASADDDGIAARLYESGTERYSKDRRFRAVLNPYENSVHVWDTIGNREVVLPGHEPSRWGGGVSSASFSDDGMKIVTAGVDRTLKIWDRSQNGSSWTQIGTLAGHEGSVTSAAFSSDGSLIVSAGSDSTARVWELPGKWPASSRAGHDNEVNSLAILPGAVSFATGSRDKTARIWNASTGAEERAFRDYADHVAFVVASGDGQSLATISGVWPNGKVEVRHWDVATGRKTRPATRLEHYVRGAAYLPDGGIWAVISSEITDCTPEIWDVISGRRISTLVVKIKRKSPEHPPQFQGVLRLAEGSKRLILSTSA